MSRLDLRRSIQVPVSGLVRLTREEIAVIDHPVFARLRRIKQTGLLNLVYPGATHTRWEHSIGVLSTAYQMLESAREGSRVRERRLASFQEARPGQGVRLHDLHQETADWLDRLVRLCALVHDLGHGPLSHAFDAFAALSSAAAKWLDDPRLAALQGLEEELLRSKSGHLRHEAVSCILFAYVWHDLGGDPDVASDVALVLTENAKAEPAELAPWYPFVRDIVSSSPIDADRMDYLKRDGRSMDVQCGQYDLDRILKSILCVCGTDAEPETFRVGWKHSGLRAIEQFVESRFRMYAEVYYHKTVRATELMLKEISREALREKMSLIDASSLDAFVGSYLALDDQRFVDLLAGRDRSRFQGNARITELGGRLLARDLWKRILDLPRDQVENAEAIVSRLRGEFPDRTFILDRLPLRAMKGLEGGASLVDVNAANEYMTVGGGAESWLNASPIMRTLRDEEEALVRIFLETKGKGDDIAPIRARAVALGAGA